MRIRCWRRGSSCWRRRRSWSRGRWRRRCSRNFESRRRRGCVHRAIAWSKRGRRVGHQLASVSIATNEPRGFTKFSHGPHLTLPQLADCTQLPCDRRRGEHGRFVHRLESAPVCERVQADVEAAVCRVSHGDGGGRSLPVVPQLSCGDGGGLADCSAGKGMRRVELLRWRLRQRGFELARRVLNPCR